VGFGFEVPVVDGVGVPVAILTLALAVVVETVFVLFLFLLLFRERFSFCFHDMDIRPSPARIYCPGRMCSAEGKAEQSKLSARNPNDLSIGSANLYKALMHMKKRHGTCCRNHCLA